MAKQKVPRLQPGEIVGDRYRIDGVVGRGGFGAVYSATQQGTGRTVALKVLINNFGASKVDGKRFKREAALVQRLTHPNVVQLLDFGQTAKGESFIAFELLQGNALTRVLKDHGALPLERAAEITRDVLLALEAAHALGIIHRDVKPGNVFLCDDDGTAKVLDFGIAKAVTGEDAGGTQLTEAGQMIGTPHYMAPEQVRGTGIDKSTDLYATGLVLAEMISGERVVNGHALIDIYMMHISPEPHALARAVAESPLRRVVERSIAKVVEHRYTSATEMLAELREAMPSLGQPRRVSTHRMAAVQHSPSSTHQLEQRDFDEPTPHSSTVLMQMPDFERRIAPPVSRGLPAAPGAPGDIGPDTLDLPPSSVHAMEATVDMDGEAAAAFAAAVHSAEERQRSGGWASQPPSGNAQQISGIHAPISRAPSSHYGSGEYSSGEYRAPIYSSPDPSFHPVAPPPASRTSAGVALLLIVVALIATVAAGVLLWAPWNS